MPILYDLVPNHTTPGGAPWFSPATIRARLALLTKGVPFETKDITYHDLRFIYTSLLGVEKATGVFPLLCNSSERRADEALAAPILERDDGSLLMDSVEIAKSVRVLY